MIQTLRISDALRFILPTGLHGPNLACSTESMGKRSSLEKVALCKHALSPNSDRITLGWWNGINLGGLISARTSSARRVWEVDRLYLAGSALGNEKDTAESSGGQTHSQAVELLESLVHQAGCRSGERIFLRLRSGNPAQHLARKSGFFPSYEETLYQGNLLSGVQGDAPLPNLRSRRPEDDYPLFQLFNAATPQPVRAATGLTFQQWMDTQEALMEQSRQWVVDCDGRIGAWLIMQGSNRNLPVQMLFHPDHAELVPQLINLASKSAGGRSWLLPDYQDPLRSMLENRGLEPVATYVVMIKSVAVPVSSPGIAAVEA